MKNLRLISIIALILSLVLTFTSCAALGEIPGLDGIFGTQDSGGITDGGGSGDTDLPPSDGDDVNPPSGGDTVDPPSGGDNVDPPSGGDDVNPPSGGDDVNPPSGGDNVDPPSGGDDVNPPSGGDDVNPPSGGDDVNPPSGGDDVDPPSGGDDVDPPSGGDNVDPPSTGDGPIPPCYDETTDYPKPGEYRPAIDSYVPLSSIPEYTGSHWTVINGNIPYFLKADLSATSYLYLSDFDSLGRAGLAVASIGSDLLAPVGTRKDPTYNPTGWIQTSYSGDVVTGSNIWNRSHLIAWSLCEDSSKFNVVTGTPYFNQLGMTKYEDMVRDYVRETGNHVLYRVVPVFVGDDLVCRGVTMEAFSIEDNGGFDTPEAGDGICFNIFMHNVNPNIIIDYKTGNTSLDPNYTPDTGEIPSVVTYIVNKNGYKIHVYTCSSVNSMSESNKIYTDLSLEELIAKLEAEGRKYSFCGNCKPNG